LYVVSGRVSVAGTSVEPWHLVTFADEGDTVSLQGSDEALILFAHADPIREPVVAHGPFVMNTPAEIHQAIRDYQAGKFNGTGKLLELAT
jgi:redox-sensitive bicupin YhaK (pirin superfamily)